MVLGLNYYWVGASFGNQESGQDLQKAETFEFRFCWGLIRNHCECTNTLSDYITLYERQNHWHWIIIKGWHLV